MPTLNCYANVYIEDYEYEHEEEFAVEDFFNAMSTEDKAEMADYLNEEGITVNAPRRQLGGTAPSMDLIDAIDVIASTPIEEFDHLPEESKEKLDNLTSTGRPAFVNQSPKLVDEIKLMVQMYESSPSPELLKEVLLLTKSL